MGMGEHVFVTVESCECTVCGRRYRYDHRGGHRSNGYRHELERELIRLTGGGCAICGYRLSAPSRLESAL